MYIHFANKEDEGAHINELVSNLTRKSVVVLCSMIDSLFGCLQ